VKRKRLVFRKEESLRNQGKEKRVLEILTLAPFLPKQLAF
jgi:hypothetical protein